MHESTLVLDGHVHLYPEYNFGQAVQIGTANLRKCLKRVGINNSNHVVSGWLLTERWDCNFFKSISEMPQKYSQGDCNFIPSAEKEALMLEKNGQVEHFVFAGRQLVSKDGLEVLSLASTLFVEDRTLSTKELIRAVNEAGGIPVLNWAPGKWFFKRGKIVQEIFETFDPSDLVIGDNPLRHVLWPKPALMKVAMKQGYKLIAGSDPLPFVGEEKYIGTYCFTFNGVFDSTKPVTSVRELLKQRVSVNILGRRNGLLAFASRETRIMMK